MRDCRSVRKAAERRGGRARAVRPEFRRLLRQRVGLSAGTGVRAFLEDAGQAVARLPHPGEQNLEGSMTHEKHSGYVYTRFYFDFALAAAFARRTSFTAAPATAMNIMKSTKPYEYHTLPWLNICFSINPPSGLYRSVLSISILQIVAPAAPGAPLCRVPCGSLPPEQTKVAPAKRAPIGLQEPVKRFLDGVSHAYTSKVNGPAMRAACRDEPRCGAHHSSPTFEAPSAEGPAGFPIDAEA